MKLRGASQESGVIVGAIRLTDVLSRLRLLAGV